MTITKTQRLTSATILAMAISLQVQAASEQSDFEENGVKIHIKRGLPQIKNTIDSPTQEIQASPTADGGELLRSISGVGGTRMGGRAIDPIIRGQKQTQLNILLDGAYLHGGCPNRMDPPTSYTAVDSYDTVQVIKGSQTVIYGGGGSGGTVLFKREWPNFGDKNYTGKVSTSYKGNGARKEVGADVATKHEHGYLRAIAHRTSADNYRDGNGDQVRSSYRSRAGALLLGFELGSSTWLEGSYEQTSEDDVLFAGAGMDNPYADADNIRLKMTHNFSGDVVRRLVVETGRSKINHTMDNFTLRPAGNMLMEAPSQSDTDTLRMIFDLQAIDIKWKAGADYQRNVRDGTLFNRMNNQTAGILWPDAKITQAGIFAEGQKDLTSNDIVKGGIRHDLVTAEARRRNENIQIGGLTGQTPEQVWGRSGAKTTENNSGGFVSWTHRINNQFTTVATLSSSARTADATERYIAKSNWRGNPDLDPERHNQAETTLQSTQDAIFWSATAWVDEVDDYILRFHPGSFTTYRNTDARLYGTEFKLSWRATKRTSLGSTLSWQRGRNTTDGENLSQISPLELSNTLTFKEDKWKAGLEWLLASNQNDTCLNVGCGGQDVQKTPGFGVVNLFGEYQVIEDVTLSAGVDNLTDKYYVRHESRNDSVNPAPIQVAEPGRSLWLRTVYSF